MLNTLNYCPGRPRRRSPLQERHGHEPAPPALCGRAGPGVAPQRRPSRPRTTRGAQGDGCASLYAVRGNRKAMGAFRSRSTEHARGGFWAARAGNGGWVKLGNLGKFKMWNSKFQILGILKCWIFEFSKFGYFKLLKCQGFKISEVLKCENLNFQSFEIVKFLKF